MRRSLWYLAHGFTVHSEKNILTAKGRRCLLKYNSKGVQTEHVISPIELKQLAVPFTILFIGHFLASIAFIGELIHHKYGGRMAGNKVKVLKGGRAAIKPPPIPQSRIDIKEKETLNKVRAADEYKVKQSITQNATSKAIKNKIKPSDVKTQSTNNQTAVTVVEMPKVMAEAKTRGAGTLIKPNTIKAVAFIDEASNKAVINVKKEVTQMK